jgi:hypothetical protein
MNCPYEKPPKIACTGHKDRPLGWLPGPTTRPVPAVGAVPVLPNHEVRARGWCCACASQPQGPSPRLVSPHGWRIVRMFPAPGARHTSYKDRPLGWCLCSPTTRSVPAVGAVPTNHEARPRGWCCACASQPQGPSPRLVSPHGWRIVRMFPAPGARHTSYKDRPLGWCLCSPTTRPVPAVGAVPMLPNHEARPRGWCCACASQPQGPSPRLVPCLCSPTTRPVPAVGAVLVLPNHEARPRGWCRACAPQPRGPSPRLAGSYNKI